MGLRQIYKPNYNYAKAGGMLSELVPAEGVQTDLFSQMQSTLKSATGLASHSAPARMDAGK